MKVGFVKSIAAMLVGTGFAMAQSPATNPKTAPRTDLSYPAAAAQQTSVPLATDRTCDTFGGIDWSEDHDSPYRFYTAGEYLLWRVRRPSIPDLTTTAPVGIVTVPQTVTNNIGVNQTVTTTPVLVPFTLKNDPGFPSQSIDLGDRSGARLTMGVWFDSDMDCGLEVSGFWTEPRSQLIRSTTVNTTNQSLLDTGVKDQVFVTSPGSPPMLTSTFEVAFPAQGTADVAVNFTSELWGAEMNLRSGGYRLGGLSFGGLAGVRYLSLREKLVVRDLIVLNDAPGSTAGADAGVLPASFQSLDRIETRNNFVAPQIGGNLEAKCYGFFLDADIKVAIGPNFQDIASTGTATSFTPGGGSRTTLGGLLTGPDDLETKHRTRVSVVPEVNLKLGYELTSWWRVYFGYDGLYMQHFARPGQQVSFTNTQTTLQVANSNTSIAIRQPIISAHDQDTWVQGINFGWELRY